MRRVLSLGTRAVLFVGLFCAGIFALSACTSSADAPGNAPSGTTPYDPEDPPDRVTMPPAVPSETSTSTVPPKPDPSVRKAEIETIVANHLLESFTALYQGDTRAFRATFYDDFAWENIDGAAALDANLGLSGPPTLPTVIVGTIHIDQPDCFVADIEFQIPERSQADDWPGATFRKTRDGHWTRGARNRQWRCDLARKTGSHAGVESLISDVILDWLSALEREDAASLRATHGSNETYFEDIRDGVLGQREFTIDPDGRVNTTVHGLVVETSACLVAEVSIEYIGVFTVDDGELTPLEPFDGLIGLGHSSNWGLDGNWTPDSRNWSCYA